MRPELLRGGVLVLLAALAVSALVGAGLLYFRPFGSFELEREALRAKIRLGMSEEQLIRSLGPPDQVQSTRTGQQTCQFPGFSHAQKLISNRCLIYLGNQDAIAYVYVDKRGSVEDVYIGGS